MTTAELSFADDGETPNHPRFPLLLHRGAFDASGRDAAAAAESLFRRNGWTRLWRNGVYPFHHYHSVCHEALAVARGWGEIRFGGEASAGAYEAAIETIARTPLPETDPVLGPTGGLRLRWRR